VIGSAFHGVQPAYVCKQDRGSRTGGVLGLLGLPLAAVGRDEPVALVFRTGRGIDAGEALDCDVPVLEAFDRPAFRGHGRTEHPRLAAVLQALGELRLPRPVAEREELPESAGRIGVRATDDRMANGGDGGSRQPVRPAPPVGGDAGGAERPGRIARLPPTRSGDSSRTHRSAASGAAAGAAGWRPSPGRAPGGCSVAALSPGLTRTVRRFGADTVPLDAARGTGGNGSGRSSGLIPSFARIPAVPLERQLHKSRLTAIHAKFCGALPPRPLA
jgi:hypothetical protein